MLELGVNVDHVATVRQARKTYEPDPVIAAAMAEQGGADGITFHLREDRRHIQVRDVEVLMQTVTVRTNFEIACEDEVLEIACRILPTWVLLVPEKREEVTTEGGLDLASSRKRIELAIARLRQNGILVSLFLDPDTESINTAIGLGVDAVELHTGPYALASGEHQMRELERLVKTAELIQSAGLRAHAGHGLNYTNVRAVAAIEPIVELNIGHSIVSRALFVGMREAVAEMRRIMDHCRCPSPRNV
jgi:pyridoxine 5-phosphate synthase